MFAYLITSKEYYGKISNDDLSCFRQRLIYANDKISRLNINHSAYIKLQFACLRYENSSNAKSILSNEEWNLFHIFLSTCKMLNIVATINLSHSKLDILRLMQDKGIFVGIHLKDIDMPLIKKALTLFPKKEKINDNFTPIFYSAHSIDNAKIAIELGADFVTLSPIFYEKNGNKALGVEIFNKLDSKLKSKIIALGGVTTDKRIMSLQQQEVAGFASISYFL